MDFARRPAGTVPYHLPEVCPGVWGAGTAAIRTALLFAVQVAECPAQLLRNLMHFVSRDAMDIEGVGPAVLQQMIEADMVRSPADLYYLEEQAVAKLERMGKNQPKML